MRLIGIPMLLLLVPLACLGCGGPRKADLEAMLQESLQRRLDTGPDFQAYGLEVTGVELVSAGDHSYRGLATVFYRNQDYPVPLEVTVDGDNVLWHTQPGAFLFLVDDDPRLDAGPSALQESLKPF